MTTREEAERIAETDEVAAAIGYLISGQSANAAVDLVHAVMDAARAPNHIVDANKNIEPVAYQAWHPNFPTWVSCSKLVAEDFAKRNEGHIIRSLYTHPAPPSELVQAVDNFLKVFDETDPEVNCYLHDAIDALRIIREGKP